MELNPSEADKRRVTWKGYSLIESSRYVPYRREITLGVFEEKANRFANMLLERGVEKGEKVAEKIRRPGEITAAVIETKAGTATISRVNRMLNQGTGCMANVIDRLEQTGKSD